MLFIIQALLSISRLGANVAPVSVAGLFMVRDEANNIRGNFPLWKSFFDAYVIAVDSRTVDDTLVALQDVIPSHTPVHVFSYKFDGFGNSRTLVFEEAWKVFPHITHVLVGDPDWKPHDVDRMDKSLLADPLFNGYQFKVSDIGRG